jgi:RimJ/RimL family protein N-acetyltransferase
MAVAAIAAARTRPGFADVFAAVDTVNAASRRVLEKLAFTPVTTLEGAFGEMILYRLAEGSTASS